MLEQTAVHRFAQDVALDRLHHIRARFERVGGGLHVQLDIQRVELKHVVMHGAVGRGSRAAIHGASGADLIATVRDCDPFGTPSGKPGKLPGIFQITQCG